VGAQRIPAPVTVSEYEQVPNPPGGRYELHHGELIFVTYPILRHKQLQRRLRELLEMLLKPKVYIADTEYPYRPLPENEAWRADVACIREDRERGAGKWLVGSPELVIEVKSPSNTKAELHDKAMTTLAGEGSIEFWVVDDDTRTVTVYSKSGMSVYGAGESVTVSIADGNLNVDDILRV
jgi:Uma2 family endonuclease